MREGLKIFDNTKKKVITWPFENESRNIDEVTAVYSIVLVFTSSFTHYSSQHLLLRSFQPPRTTSPYLLREEAKETASVRRRVLPLIGNSIIVKRSQPT